MSGSGSPPGAPVTDSRTYEGTRRAWTHIWQDADIERELRTRAYARSIEIRRRFMPHLRRGEPILEAGCGLGVELLGLDDDKYTAVGVDYVPEALWRLKRYRATLRLAAGDIHALPFRSATFGAYLSFGVIEHFEFGPAPALAEAARVLRAGGILILTVPAPNPVWRMARLRRRWFPRGQDHNSYFETAYSARTLEGHVRRAGFDIVERHPVGHSFTLWTASRIFRRSGYYETTAFAERAGAWLARVLPWSTSFATLIIGRKKAAA
jgi:SAM-dependent methyltransferase